MRIRSFDSVNSAMILQYGNNDKNVNCSNNNTNSNYGYSFYLFSNVLMNLQKQCRSLSSTHKFQKGGTKKLTICRIKLDVKNMTFRLPQSQS